MLFQNFKFALLQGGNRCGCASKVDKSKRGKCNKPCAGYSDAKCGGADAVTVFDTGKILVILQMSVNTGIIGIYWNYWYILELLVYTGNESKYW